MISKQSIDDIHAATRIVEVIDDFVQLKKRGVNFIGLCPFHGEKTPSFTVSPVRNIFKCFGCGKGGSAIHFLMEHEGLSYPEALRYLAKKFNVTIEETVPDAQYSEERKKNDSLFVINEYAQDFYQKQLLNTDAGKSIGLSYFKERGYIRKTIEQFGLGYAPRSRDALVTQATTAGYNIEWMRELGLVTDKDRDFFFQRVIFPIHNLSGKVIAFAGRQLDNNKKSPKYINSKESLIYNKRKILYGLYQARKSIRKFDQCILVEGYTDVLSMVQNGVENVVASSGTALTTDQIRLIKRYTKNLLLLFDGDAAGLKAAIRGVDLVLKEDLNVYLVQLPTGEDPDSYIKSVGSTAFADYIKTQKRDFILFKSELLLEESQGDPIRKAELIKDIVISLAHIPDAIKRSVFIQQCSALLDIEEGILVAEVNSSIRKLLEKGKREDFQNRQVLDSAPRQSEQHVSNTPKSTNEDIHQERAVLKTLLLFGDRFLDAEEDVTIAEFILGELHEIQEYIADPSIKSILHIYSESLNHGTVDLTVFLNHENPDIARTAVDVISTPFQLSKNWEDMWNIVLQTQPEPEKNHKNEAEQVILHLKDRKLKHIIKENQEKIKVYEAEGSEDKQLEHLQVLQELHKIRRSIAERMNNVIIR